MPQAVLQKVGAAGMPQLLLSAAPRLATSLNSNKLSIKVTSSSGASGKQYFHLRYLYKLEGSLKIIRTEVSSSYLNQCQKCMIKVIQRDILL